MGVLILPDNLVLIFEEVFKLSKTILPVALSVLCFRFSLKFVYRFLFGWDSLSDSSNDDSCTSELSDSDFELPEKQRDFIQLN